MIKHFGARAHDFSVQALQPLLDQLETFELDGVQLAPVKFFDHIGSHQDWIAGRDLAEITQGFKDYKKTIQVLGCYLNHAHPSEEKRNDFAAFTKGYLDTAKALGQICECVATESFTLNGDGSPNKEDHTRVGYQRFLRQIVPLVAYAEALGVYLAIEPAKHHIIHDIATTRQLVSDIGSKNMKLIFDPSNLMTPYLATRQDALFYDFFEKFEASICAVHAKDFMFAADEKSFLSLGEGALDYKSLFRFAQQSQQPVNMLLEGFKSPPPIALLKNL